MTLPTTVLSKSYDYTSTFLAVIGPAANKALHPTHTRKSLLPPAGHATVTVTARVPWTQTVSGSDAADAPAAAALAAAVAAPPGRST